MVAQPSHQDKGALTLEEISTQNGPFNHNLKIPCHHVLKNIIVSNLKYRIALKQFFNINLGIGIIKKTIVFVHIFDISPCVFTQIPSERTCWMWNLIPHPTHTHTA